MTAMACPSDKDCDCAVALTDEKCKDCEFVITDEHRQNYEDVLEMTKQALIEMQNFRCKLWKSILTDLTFFSSLDIDICRNLDKRQKKVLHSYNIWRLKTLDLAFDAAIDFESWDEAVVFGNKFIQGLK